MHSFYQSRIGSALCEVLAFRLTNSPSSGRGHGHVTFFNFGKYSVISRKWCKIETYLQWKTNTKYVWPIEWHDWVRQKVNFDVVNLCNTHDSGNIVCLHINWKVHAAYYLNFIVKSKGLLEVTGSHIRWKSGNILETVLDRDVVTTGQ